MRNYRVFGCILATMMVFLAGCSSLAPRADEVIPEFDAAALLYFGNDSLPGSEPEPFGLGWFTGGFHSAPVFTPDGKTVWWAGRYATETIYTSRYENGSWTDQETVSFSDSIKSYRDPFISPDGLKFYFISTAPIPGQDDSGKENLWMMEWTSTGWQEPQPLPDSVNSYLLHWTISVASNYDLYFAATIDGNPDIFKSAFQEGAYHEPVPLGYPVNSEELEFTPNIAPDQSYLLFGRAKDNKSPTQLYISYAQDDGWSEPIQVENVDSCISPIVTPDRQYVIYLRSASQLEWRDTSFIDELKPSE